MLNNLHTGVFSHASISSLHSTQNFVQIILFCPSPCHLLSLCPIIFYVMLSSVDIALTLVAYCPFVMYLVPETVYAVRARNFVFNIGLQCCSEYHPTFAYGFWISAHLIQFSWLSSHLILQILFSLILHFFFLHTMEIKMK